MIGDFLHGIKDINMCKITIHNLIKKVSIVNKKKGMFKNVGDKIEDMGHDMASGIKSFSNSVEHAGEKMVKDMKKASKKILKK